MILKKEDGFSYKYSAHEQEEIRRIREKYTEKEKTVSKLDIIKKLDKSVTDAATVASLAVGIIGLLVMGTGMSLVMVWGGDYMLAGIIIGLIGIALVASAYPIYNFVVRTKRKKIAPEILRLTDELIEE